MDDPVQPTDADPGTPLMIGAVQSSCADPGTPLMSGAVQTSYADPGTPLMSGVICRTPLMTAVEGPMSPDSSPTMQRDPLDGVPHDEMGQMNEFSLQGPAAAPGQPSSGPLDHAPPSMPQRPSIYMRAHLDESIEIPMFGPGGQELAASDSMTQPGRSDGNDSPNFGQGRSCCAHLLKHMR